MSFASCLAAADATGDCCTAAPHGGAVDCSADDEQAEHRKQSQEVAAAVGSVSTAIRRIAPAHEIPVQKWMSLISGRRATAAESDGR
jgi:hypothetical protein